MGKKRSPTYKKIKRFLKQLAGQDVWSRPQTKIDSHRLGGWVINTDNLNKDSIVYSLGVGEDIEFDKELIKRYNLTIQAFDPTPNSIKWIEASDVSDDFDFHPYGISSIDGELKLYPRISRRGKKSKVMYTLVNDGDPNDAILINVKRLKTIMSSLGHKHIDVLKMDIEGAEYQVIDEIVNSNIEIKQILVEFHHRFPTIGKAKTADAIKKLNELGYKIFFISEPGWDYSFIKNN